MSNKKFTTGDVVRLRSGGANMTVYEVDGDDVHVTWMDGTSQVKRDVFKEAVLTFPPPMTT